MKAAKINVQTLLCSCKKINKENGRCVCEKGVKAKERTLVEEISIFLCVCLFAICIRICQHPTGFVWIPQA